MQLLDAEGIDANEDTIIITGRSGYQINPALSLDDQSDRPSSHNDGIPVQITAEDRQNWFLTQLKVNIR